MFHNEHNPAVTLHCPRHSLAMTARWFSNFTPFTCAFMFGSLQSLLSFIPVFPFSSRDIAENKICIFLFLKPYSDVPPWQHSAFNGPLRNIIPFILTATGLHLCSRSEQYTCFSFSLFSSIYCTAVPIQWFFNPSSFGNGILLNTVTHCRKLWRLGTSCTWTSLMRRDIFVSVSTDSSSWRSSYPHNITPRSVSTHSCDLHTQSFFCLFFFFLKQHVFSSGTCSFIQTNISLYEASEGCFSPLCPLIATSNYLWPLLIVLDQFSRRQAFSPCEIFKKFFWEF